MESLNIIIMIGIIVIMIEIFAIGEVTDKHIDKLEEKFNKFIQEKDKERDNYK